MVTLCQKCGDPGISIALIYCDKCQEVAEHRYCLDVIPKTFTEYVTWFCKDCNPKVPVKDELKISSLSPRQVSRSEVKIQQIGSGKLNQNRKRSSESGKKKKKRRSKSIPSSRMKSMTSKDDTNLHGTKNLGMEQIHDDGVVGIHTLEYTKCKVRSYNNYNTKMTRRNIDSTISMASAFEVDPNEHVPSQPIFEPVWRGCFTLFVGEFGIIDGLAAHLSTKASLQVYEEARLLSESLRPELIPRLNIWPRGFVDTGPKDENIGLYFFPQKERDEKQYDILIDHMIEYDLAMKAAGANADLLVFTSTELPLNNWRFQAKYYLWGVFRGKEASSSRVKNQALTCNSSNGITTFSSAHVTEIVAENENHKSHMRGSPHSPLSNCSSHGSDL